MAKEGGPQASAAFENANQPALPKSTSSVTDAAFRVVVIVFILSRSILSRSILST